MPEKLFRCKAVYDWSKYEGELAKSPLTSRYLSSSLRNWVQEAKYTPLQVPWLAALLEFGDVGIEGHLQNFEQAIGEQALEELVADLFRESSPREASREINSFYAEYAAAEYIRTTHGAVKKVISSGDWEADGVLFSVKAVLGSDFNYELMRNLLLGMVLVEENQVLRDWSSMHIDDLVGADYRFIKRVLDFLEDELLPRLESVSAADLAGPMRSLWKEVRPFSEKKDDGREELCVSLSCCQNAIIARIEAAGSDKQLLSSASLRFGRAKDDIVEIGTELDGASSPYMSSAHLRALSRKITEKVALMTIAFERQPSNFQGWLDLPIHPHYERFASTSSEFRQMLRTSVGEPGFPIYLCLRGGFDLARTQVLRISPS